MRSKIHQKNLSSLPENNVLFEDAASIQSSNVVPPRSAKRFVAPVSYYPENTPVFNALMRRNSSIKSKSRTTSIAADVSENVNEAAAKQNLSRKFSFVSGKKEQLLVVPLKPEISVGEKPKRSLSDLSRKASLKAWSGLKGLSRSNSLQSLKRSPSVLKTHILKIARVTGRSFGKTQIYVATTTEKFASTVQSSISGTLSQLSFRMHSRTPSRSDDSFLTSMSVHSFVNNFKDPKFRANEGVSNLFHTLADPDKQMFEILNQNGSSYFEEESKSHTSSERVMSMLLPSLESLESKPTPQQKVSQKTALVVWPSDSLEALFDKVDNIFKKAQGLDALVAEFSQISLHSSEISETASMYTTELLPLSPIRFVLPELGVTPDFKQEIQGALSQEARGFYRMI